MGLKGKSYLRFAQEGSVGVIASSGCNSVVHPSGHKNVVVTGALEHVALWNVRQGGLVSFLFFPPSIWPALRCVSALRAVLARPPARHAPLPVQRDPSPPFFVVYLTN